MLTLTNDELAACDAFINEAMRKAYWPWWLALAYCQRSENRAAALHAVAHAAGQYKPTAGRSGTYQAAACMDALNNAAFGEGDGPFDWSAYEKLEERLIGPLRAGQLDLWGRPSPQEDLDPDPVPVSSLVGCEVDGCSTFDLVVSPWRDSRSLDKVLTGERKVRFFDLHLKGAAVCQLVDSVDLQERLEALDETLSPDREAFEEYEKLGGKPRLGFWSEFCAGAWIASRSTAFVAAVQRYEQDYCPRSDPYALSGLSLLLEGILADRFGVPLSQAFRELRDALTSEVVTGAKATDLRTGEARLVRADEWDELPNQFGEASGELLVDSNGVSFAAHLYRCRFPAHQLTESFPAPEGAASRQGSATPRSRFNNGRRPTAQQQHAFAFFELADRSKFLRDQERYMTQTALHEEYKKWIARERHRGDPWEFSRFKEMLRDYRVKGRRVVDGRWSEKTD